MQDHRKLLAFQKADEFVLEVYKATKSFPKEELFGLTSQFRRAAVSVPANIVEGCGREGLKEYQNFLNIAFGSLRESGYYIDLSLKLAYISPDQYNCLYAKYDEASRILFALIRSLK